MISLESDYDDLPESVRKWIDGRVEHAKVNGVPPKGRDESEEIAGLVSEHALPTDERLTILANKNVSRGKFAAAAVHAALYHYGIEHGAVIVLGESSSTIETECAGNVVIHDAGRTEVDPGTVTAGVRNG